MPALVGGGMRAKPGEISLAHHGVLFLDELAEFSRVVLDALRQPLETGKVVVARANNNYTYPADFQLIAAMNPCRCDYLGDPARAFSRAPECGRQYSAKVSGPIMDRFDLIIEVPEVTPQMLMADEAAESSAVIFERIMTARKLATARSCQGDGTLNAKLAGDDLDMAISMEDDGKTLLKAALEQQQLSARAYHKIMRVARTIADLDNKPVVTREHLAEALAYRAMPLFA
jgi:magnesium chelatase family protein